jgi:hypothetical protein
MEEEFVIFANIPKIRVYHRTGFFSSNKVNFVITNKRIALVPLKAGKEEVSFNFEDISGTFPGFSTIEKNPNWGEKASTSGHKADLQILMKTSSGKKKQKFEIHASGLTIIKNLGKDLAKDFKAQMTIMAEQGALYAVDKNRLLSADQKEAAKWDLMLKQAKDCFTRSADPKASSKKGEHFTARNIIVELVDAGVRAYNG